MSYLQRVSILRLAGAAEPARARTSGPARLLLLAAKCIVTAMCFWYLAHRVEWPEIARVAGKVKLDWALLGIAALMTQLPLVSLRWSKIIDVLDRGRERTARMPVFAISTIATFFGQIMPNIASESLRAWMLARLGIPWQRALASVLIDRAIGLGALLAVGLISILPVSGLAASAGIREPLIASLVAILAASTIGLVSASYLGAILRTWRYTGWLGKLAQAAHDVVLGATGAGIVGLAVGVQLLAITSIWLIGRSLGLAFEIADAGTLFIAAFGSILLPISISGWGVRELAVTALLGSAGVSIEQALLFSVLLGTAQLAAGIPGALIWLIYVPRPSHYPAAER